MAKFFWHSLARCFDSLSVIATHIIPRSAVILLNLEWLSVHVRISRLRSTPASFSFRSGYDCHGYSSFGISPEPSICLAWVTLIHLCFMLLILDLVAHGLSLLLKEHLSTFIEVSWLLVRPLVLSLRHFLASLAGAQHLLSTAYYWNVIAAIQMRLEVAVARSSSAPISLQFLRIWWTSIAHRHILAAWIWLTSR